MGDKVTEVFEPIKLDMNITKTTIDTPPVVTESPPNDDASNDASDDASNVEFSQEETVESSEKPRNDDIIIENSGTSISLPRLSMVQHNNVLINDLTIDTNAALLPSRNSLQFVRLNRDDSANNDKITIKLSTTEPPETISRLIDQLNDTAL